MEYKEIKLNGESVNIETSIDPELMQDEILIEDDLEKTLDLSEILKETGENDG